MKCDEMWEIWELESPTDVELDAVREHLLVCGACHERLTEAEDIREQIEGADMVPVIELGGDSCIVFATGPTDEKVFH